MSEGRPKRPFFESRTNLIWFRVATGAGAVAFLVSLFATGSLGKSLGAAVVTFGVFGGIQVLFCE